jgi:hypothetical protein
MLNETPFFLASAPVSALDRAKQLVTSHGGEYAAGDKDDIFNSMNLADQESWKAGWKGKVEQSALIESGVSREQVQAFTCFRCYQLSRGGRSHRNQP